MVTTSAFNATNAVGKSAEVRIGVLFLQQKWKVWFPDVRTRWDVSVEKEGVCESIEIKNEENYATSGNVCVEIAQGDPLKPSGVVASESSFFVHYFGDVSLVLRTRSFQLFLDSIRRTERLVRFAGADNNNCGYVLARSRFVGQPWAREVESKQIPAAVSTLRKYAVSV